MADNTELNPGTGGDVMRSIDRTAIKTEVVTLDINPGGAEVLMTGDDTNGIDVDVTRVQGTVAVSGTVAVTGVATAANQTTVIGHLDGVEGLLTTIDADTGGILTAVQLIDNAISGSEMQVDVVASLPAGTNNIGDVDVLSLPASTNTIEVVGDVAEDQPLAGNPVRVGARASAAQPSAMSGDNDIVTPWASRHGGLIKGRALGSDTSLSFAAGLQSLASSATAGTVSAEVDLSTIVPNDVIVHMKVQMTTAGSPTGFVEVYVLSSNDGTIYTGDTNYSGTAAAYTLGAAGSPNLTLATVIKAHANTAAYTQAFSLKQVLGFVPAFFALVIVNNTGIALHSSGNGGTYRAEW